MRHSCLAPLSSATQQQPLPLPPPRLHSKLQLHTNRLDSRRLSLRKACVCPRFTSKAHKTDQLDSRHRYDWNILPAGIAGPFLHIMDNITRNIHYSPTLPYLHVFILFIRISRTHCSIISTRSAYPKLPTQSPHPLRFYFIHLSTFFLAAFLSSESASCVHIGAFSFVIFASTNRLVAEPRKLSNPRSTRTFTLMAPRGSGPSRMWTDTDARP